MKWIVKLAWIGLLVPAFSLSVTTECDDPKSPELTRVYFVNGMENTYDELLKSRQALEDKVGMHSYISYGNSVNNKEAFISQLLEVFRQRTSETSHFWEWIQDLSIAPQWFQDAFNARMSEMANYEVYRDLDLRIMVEEYLQDLRSGKKVVLVSHSQGNFYANNAYQFIKDTTHYDNSIGIVAVGTPAGRVQDGGPHTTNSLDLVINVVRPFFYVLPANMTYNQPGDRLNHSFIDTYLAAAGSDIRSHVYGQINRLVKPAKADECKEEEDIAVTVKTVPATSVSVNSARLNGTVVSGKNIDTWINFKKLATPASCAATAGNKDGKGNYNTGDAISELKIYLAQGTTYYYRVCGKGTNNRISDGGVVRITTDNPVVVETVSGKTVYNRAADKHFVQYVGRVAKGNSVNIWFVHSTGTFTTPKCSTGTKIDTTYRGYNNIASQGDEFTTYQGASNGWSSGDYIFATGPGTRYMFRACGYKNGVTYSGDVMSVTTSKDNRPGSIPGLFF